MHVLFVLPLHTPGHDHRFDEEADALEYLDIPYSIISIEAVVDGAWDLLEDRLPESVGEVLYRGFMLTEAEYEALADELEERGSWLRTSPLEYANAHYLPSWHDLLEGQTPPALWTFGEDLGEAWELAEELGAAPRMIKDHVKSAKEEWERCAYIPPDCTREHFEAVCEAFIDVRAERFERGLVVRELLELAPLPARSPARPLYEEYRLFFQEGELAATYPYYDAPGYGDAEEVGARFEWLGGAINSPFFTADVAKRGDGGWTVLEVGDGGVSFRPHQIDALSFYEALSAGW